jgi:hypothetical protein
MINFGLALVFTAPWFVTLMHLSLVEQRSSIRVWLVSAVLATAFNIGWWLSLLPSKTARRIAMWLLIPTCLLTPMFWFEEILWAVVVGVAIWGFMFWIGRSRSEKNTQPSHSP